MDVVEALPREGIPPPRADMFEGPKNMIRGGQMGISGIGSRVDSVCFRLPSGVRKRLTLCLEDSKQPVHQRANAQLITPSMSTVWLLNV